MRIRTRILLTTANCALSAPAYAVDFNPQGNATFAPGALFTYDFEGTLPSDFTPQSVQPLEGQPTASLAAGQVASLPNIPTTGKHAVALSVFARGGAVNGYLVVRYTSASKLSSLLVPRTRSE